MYSTTYLILLSLILLTDQGSIFLFPSFNPPCPIYCGALQKEMGGTRMYRQVVVFICIVLLLIPRFALAESTESDDDQAQMAAKETSFVDTVLVFADENDIAVTPQNGPGFGALIKTELIPETVAETADVLENVVGVTVKQYGGLGMFSLVSIRGSESNQVSLFLNNIPLNSASSGALNLSSIPMTFLQSIEVYRGWVPASLGQPAMGGAINFVTRSGSPAKQGELSLSYGSFETARGTFSYHQATEKQSLLLHLSHTRSAGDFQYYNDNGTPNNRSDDHYVVRKNGDFSSYETLLTYINELTTQFRLSLTGTYIYKEQGIPGINTIQTTNSQLKTAAGMIALKGELYEFFHDLDYLDWTLFYIRNSDHFIDPEREISLQSIRSDSKTNRGGIDLHYTLSALAHNTLSTSVGMTWEENQTNNEVLGIFSAGEIKKERLITSYSLDNELNLFQDKLTIRPSLRYDTVMNEDSRQGEDDIFHAAARPRRSWSFFSPQLALKVNLSEVLVAKASSGFYSRYPTLSELYGDRGTTVGNPDLLPETGINRDVGFLLTGNCLDQCRYFLEYAFFVKESADLLIYVQNSQYTFRPENIGSARIRGHELVWTIATPKLLNLSFNYTYQDGRDTSPIPYYRNNRLPNRPVHELFTSLTFRIKPVSFHYSLNYQSLNFLDRANRKEVPDRLMHNVSLEWREIIAGTRFVLEMKNVSNNQISDVAGYPLPGRSYYCALHYNF
ncbi:TonB-dependent receptor plug domain-containing protein [candidate division CSSED10-310 bacterium]|uniref:TonB-dependent receptor plug domain-containing protein n=1 Tax=candidate division CSSED10-310 bacterium TaxID=2855610 RepID=A0ABV6Z3R7_UNCC1